MKNYLACFIGGVKDKVTVNAPDVKPLTAQTAQALATEKMEAMFSSILSEQYKGNLDAGNAYFIINLK